MTRGQKFVRGILKTLAAILAAGNLIALFVFDYNIPGLSRILTSEASSATSGSAGSSDSGSSSSIASLTIEVPDEDLEYSGDGTLDLLDGVRVLDASGEESEDSKITYTVSEGSSLNEKKITYSVTDDSGIKVTASRTLKLDGQYNGPEITVSDDLPTFDSEEISVIAAVLADRGLIQADDGFGNDITDAVTASVESGSTAGTYAVELSVTNDLYDSDSVSITIELTEETEAETETETEVWAE
ncbi:MAG: hypothetical protein LUH07_04420 [Lachnospiraceae bacterium]|nr:hypothetical protein [Lachnospiraceae bacterium]